MFKSVSFANHALAATAVGSALAIGAGTEDIDGYEPEYDLK